MFKASPLKKHSDKNGQKSHVVSFLQFFYLKKYPISIRVYDPYAVGEIYCILYHGRNFFVKCGGNSLV